MRFYTKSAEYTKDAGDHSLTETSFVGIRALRIGVKCTMLDLDDPRFILLLHQLRGRLDSPTGEVVLRIVGPGPS